jgi:cobalamin biosynthesis protein CobT
MSQKPPTQNKILVLEAKKQETGAAEETARLAGKSEDVLLQEVELDEPSESNMEEEGSEEDLEEEKREEEGSEEDLEEENGEEEGSEEDLEEENREEEGSEEENSQNEDEGDEQPEEESGRSSLKDQDDKTHGYEHDYKVWSLKIQFTGGKHHLYLYVATETVAGSRKCPDYVCIKNFHG